MPLPFLPRLPDFRALFRRLLLAVLVASGLTVILALLLAPATPAKGASVEVFSSIDDGCYVLNQTPDPQYSNQFVTYDVVLSLPYTGTVEQASLRLRSTNVRPGSVHPILVNGVDIGQSPPADGFSTCDDGPGVPIQSYPLTPTLLHPGVNVIRLTAAGTTDLWGVNYAALSVQGTDLKGGRFLTIQFPGEGGALVDAELLEPPDMSSPRPLLLLFHGWNGVPIDPLLTDYTSAAVSRNWIVVSPMQRGLNALGPAGAPLASLRSQHDAMALIDYMRSHYDIDPDRIYVGGFSMGGMMAATLAAKYPDVFAAVVTHKAITDLSAWFYESSSYRQSRIITETGGTPAQVPFEYQRRSPLSFASNLENLPIAIIHGDVDTTVPPHHAQDFYNAIAATNPTRVELEWYHGDHADEPAVDGLGGEWAARFMENYTRVDSPTRLRLRTDEAKSFYWLTIGKRSTTGLTAVDVDLDRNQPYVSARITDTQPVDLAFDLERMGLRSSRELHHLPNYVGAGHSTGSRHAVGRSPESHRTGRCD